MDFSDRFQISSPGFDPATLPNLTQDQIRVVCPELAEMIEQVKAYSVLLRKKTAQEIYNVITRQADPRIALILAAGRDNHGNQLFPNMSRVKAFMFGPPPSSALVADVEFEEHDIFVDGLKRVSGALTASIIIAQLAQIPEQANHAIQLEKQAIEDIDRILQVPELAAFTTPSTTTETIKEKPALYFEVLDLDLGSRSLKVEAFMPSELVSDWGTVGVYTGSLNTSNIVADIADYINSITLNNTSTNILAAPVLAGEYNLHKVEFDTRLRQLNIYTDVIIVKITYLDEQDNLIVVPFNWGPEVKYLKPYSINSVLLEIQQAKVTTLTDSESTTISDLSVLYFRRRYEDEEGNPIDLDLSPAQIFTFRVSPTMDENLTVPFPRIAPDEDRPNQIATLLLNELFAMKYDTKALGTIIQNDPYDTTPYYSAVQLRSWTLTRVVTELILDVLELPIDIEVALGNILGPVTKFAHKPRSIKVASIYTGSEVAAIDTTAEGLAPVGFTKSRKSKVYQIYDDVRESDYIDYWDRKQRIAPPYPYHHRPIPKYPYHH